jgi:DNA primase
MPPKKKVDTKSSKKEEELKRRYQEELKKKEELKRQWQLQKQNEKQHVQPTTESRSSAPSSQMHQSVGNEYRQSNGYSSNPAPYFQSNSRSNVPIRSNSPSLSQNQKKFVMDFSADDTERMKEELKNELKEELKAEFMMQQRSMNPIKQSKQSMQMDRYEGTFKIL